MEKIKISSNATRDEKWNALIDVLYGEEGFETEELIYLLTSLDFHNEMESGLFEGVLESYSEQIEEDGIHEVRDAVAEGLRYIGADDVANLVANVFPSLQNAMDKYDRALQSGKDVEVQEEGFTIAFKNANDKYLRLGEGHLQKKIENYIDSNSESLFEVTS